MNFIGCLSECMRNREFVREFDRLHQTKIEEYLSSERSSIDDINDDLPKFLNFVFEHVWRPLTENQGNEI